MKHLKILGFDKNIILEEPAKYILVIENKTLFYKFNRYLFNEFYGPKQYVQLFDGPNEEKVDSECAFIHNLFNLDLNTKKNINALYKTIKKLYKSSLKESLDDINKKIMDMVSELALDFDAELTLNEEIKEDDIFKITNLRFEDNDLGLLESFVKYVQVIYELQGITVFFVLHLSEYFTKAQIEKICHELEYKNITLICVEQQYNDNYENFIPLIIDSDLCNISR